MNIRCKHLIDWRMKNYTIYICIGLLVCLFSLPFLFVEKEDESKPVKPQIETNRTLVIPSFITIASTGEKIDFETYVMGVVAAEMPASFSEEALKAQAVAARTYAVQSMGYKIKSGLRVSAISRHPKSKEWYILSSAEKLLVIASSDWHIKSVYDLDSSTFNQPEGIAFDKDLNLYISNEGDEITNGNILKFKPLSTK